MKIAGQDLSISSSGIIVETLDDKTLDILDVQYYGFTNKKKVEQDHILYYNNKEFLEKFLIHKYLIILNF